MCPGESSGLTYLFVYFDGVFKAPFFLVGIKSSF